MGLQMPLTAVLPAAGFELKMSWKYYFQFDAMTLHVFNEPVWPDWALLNLITDKFT